MPAAGRRRADEPYLGVSCFPIIGHRETSGKHYRHSLRLFILVTAATGGKGLMDIFCTLPSLVEMVFFCLVTGAILGVSLANRPAAAPATASGCSAAMASPHPMARVPGYREEVSGWKRTT